MTVGKLLHANCNEVDEVLIYKGSYNPSLPKENLRYKGKRGKVTGLWKRVKTFWIDCEHLRDLKDYMVIVVW